jgi:hypothetical protein
MDSYQRGNTWTFLGHFERTPLFLEPFTFSLNGPVDTPVPTLHWGRLPSLLTGSVTMNQIAPGKWQGTVPGLRPLLYYFFKVDAGTKWTNYGYTGVYEVFSNFAI